MWAPLATELGIPWRAAEAMHWQLGEADMARRAGVTPFSLAPGSAGPSMVGMGGPSNLGPGAAVGLVGSGLYPGPQQGYAEAGAGRAGFVAEGQMQLQAPGQGQARLGMGGRSPGYAGGSGGGGGGARPGSGGGIGPGGSAGLAPMRSREGAGSGAGVVLPSLAEMQRGILAYDEGSGRGSGRGRGRGEERGGRRAGR